jgi:hypothetical protein
MKRKISKSSRRELLKVRLTLTRQWPVLMNPLMAMICVHRSQMKRRISKSTKRRATQGEIDLDEMMVSDDESSTGDDMCSSESDEEEDLEVL